MSVPLCIEAEIFPFIYEKIEKKLIQKVDVKLSKQNDKFVTAKAFDYTVEDLKFKVE